MYTVQYNLTKCAAGRITGRYPSNVKDIWLSLNLAFQVIGGQLQNPLAQGISIISTTVTCLEINVKCNISNQARLS